MIDVPIVYAFTAGLAASVNPCGFAMLPAFAAYRLGVRDPDEPLPTTLLRAVRLGLVATVGFVAVFAIVGVILSVGGRALIALFPWAGLSVGVILALLGIVLFLSNRSFGLGIAERVHVRPTGGMRGVLLFGIGYAIASLGCTLPIFFVVVGGALATSGLGAAVVLFISYGLGMGVVLTAVAIATALSKGVLVRGLRRVVPYIERVGALLLVGVGIYLISYWVHYV